MSKEATNSYHYVNKAPTRLPFFQWTDLFILPLLWKGFQRLMTLCFGELLGRVLLPARQIFGCRPNKKVGPTSLGYLSSDKDTNVERYLVKTDDGVELETYQVSQEPHDKERPHILLIGGNGTDAKSYPELMAYFSSTLGATAVSFSHRGVSGSDNVPVRSEEDLMRDAIAEVQRFLDKGVDPRKIIIYGHSLGAGTGALTAAYFHRQGKPIKIFSDRSFCSTADVFKGWLVRLIRPFWATIADPFVRFVLTVLRYRVDEAEALRSIPRQDRDYQLVRYNMSWINEEIHDEVITREGATENGLQEENRKERHALRNVPKLIEALDQKIRERCLRASHMISILDCKNTDGTEGITHFRNFFFATTTRCHSNAKLASDKSMDLAPSVSPVA